jgi:hypothetical protein
MLDFRYDLPAPAGYSVTPNHLGYEYLAQQLASRGYIVVSINANRGINIGPAITGDTSLILARGRLVLKHLQKLSEWSVNGGAPATIADLTGKIDFSNVGLMGHSRGGQGVRAAYVLYKDLGSAWPGRILRPVNFKAIFELAPTDEPTTRTLSVPVTSRLEAKGTKWNVLLPMCDGDLTSLPGVQPFDRLMVPGSDDPPTQKSTYTVWGSNHNFYNTEWQQNDARWLTGCTGDGNVPVFSSYSISSVAQQQVGSESIVGFFRANVGTSVDDTFNQSFSPKYQLPSAVTSITRVDRGFTSSSTIAALEDFNASGLTNYCASPNQCSADVSVVKTSVPNHDVSLSAGRIDWVSSGDDQFFQTNWKGPGSTIDISGFQQLEFRASRQRNALLNPSIASVFDIQLIMGDGSHSGSLELCKYYAKLSGPVGGYALHEAEPNVWEWIVADHPILETIRIPLVDFTNVDLADVRGVRFVFNGTETGSIYIANVRFAN